ncbi:MAG: hypothetical protein MI922_27260, partial [Bacteroidales bacterium]|nr:hypothetical protein [Bacteroidales bacterium]
MAPNPYKLANPNQVTDYNLYRDNQVLTAQQLNKNVKYFDRQLRLSRVCLQGCGIVCGMEVSYNSGQKKITISKGNGITTDGDLLLLDKKTTYTKFKLFDDQKAKYPPFLNGETQINAWQLFPGNSTVSDIEPLTAFNTSERNLSNMVVVLYLSSYEEPPKDCNTTDCDNLGLKQINNLVVLLVSKDDIDNIIDSNDALFDKNEEIKALTSNYNELSVPRVVLSELPASDYLKLHDVYHKVITETGPALRNALIDTLNDKSLNFITGKLYDVTTNSIWKSVLNQAFSAVKSYSALNIQYRYDFLKDLTEAYNEFVYELNELVVECCPSVNSFPKHLMLRELVLPSTNEAPGYRHSFYPSPIITNADERIRRIQALHLRINDMIRTFRVEIANVSELEDNVPVRITPSTTPINPLGLRAIPYYYSKQKANKYWNYDKTLRRKENTVLSYHAEKYAASTAITNPLDYSIDKNDFFRIEGHIGRTYQNVLIELIGKKTAEGLPFDVIALKLGSDTSKMVLENDHCELREIESEYNLWLNDMDSLYTMVSG